MDLELLERTLADLGEPRYRAGQVWRWTARGADGYDAMSDLPLALREALGEACRSRSLSVEREAHAQTARSRRCS